MASQSLQPGTYPAHPDCFSVCESQKGNLMVVIRVLLDGTDMTLNYYGVIACSDGTLSTKTIDSLKEWSGWDGVDPYWFMDHAQELQQVPVDVVTENETFTGNDGQQRVGARVKFINRPNSGRSALPQVADRSAILAKFGARLRANAATGKKFVPGQAAAAPAASAPAASSKPAAKPAPNASPAAAPFRPAASPQMLPSHNATDCWELFLEKVAPLNLSDTDRNNKWFALCDSVNASGQDAIEANREWNKVWVAVTKLDVKSGELGI